MNKFTLNNFYKISLMLILFSFSACDDTINQDDLDNVIIPSTNISFAEHIQPIFNARCNNSGCHNDGDRAGGLSLTSHANATESFLIVAPGSPDNSVLVWAIEGRTTEPMPPVGYRPLTSNQIQGIRNWIKEGAKNN